MKKTVIALLVASISATGCATYSKQEISTKINTQSKEAIGKFTSAYSHDLEPVVHDDYYVNPKAIDYVPAAAGNISISISKATLSSIAQQIASQSGISLVFANTTDPSKQVSVDFKNLTTEKALKDLAMAAGYAVVLNKEQKSATFTDRATYTFKLPKISMDDLATKYSISNQPGGSSSGGGKGGGTSNSSNYTISGGSKNDTSSLAKFLEEMAGGDAKVNVLAESGIISVRAPAQQLSRITAFLESHTKDTLSQVSLDTYLVSVNLNDEMSTGIDWSQVINGSMGKAISLTTADSAVPSAALNAKFTTASITSVVKAMEKVSNVKIMSKPSATVLNHTPHIIFEGINVPYVGEVSTSVAGTSGTATTGGSLSYAMDGLSLSIKPDIIDNNHLTLQLAPVLSSINKMSQFKVGDSVITGPEQPVTQAFYNVLAEHGKTYIIGGAQVSKSSLSREGLPGIAGTEINRLLGGNNDNGSKKEFYILLHATIIPGPKYNPLIGESL